MGERREANPAPLCIRQALAQRAVRFNWCLDAAKTDCKVALHIYGQLAHTQAALRCRRPR